MIEIEILDTGKRLPLSKKERLRMTFQAADFGEAGSGSGSFSTTCSVPITPQVIEALGFSIVPNATSILSAYKNIKARILQDENEIDKGFIRIDEENTTKKELKITFYGRNVDWFTALGDRTLRDLDLSEYDHVKTTAIVNEERTDGFIYLPADYDGVLTSKNSATINSNEIFPATYVNMLVKKIFKEAGFKVAGTLFQKPLFNRLLIPFNNSEELLPRKTQDVYKADAYSKVDQITPTYTSTDVKILFPFDSGSVPQSVSSGVRGYNVIFRLFAKASDKTESWDTTTSTYYAPQIMDVAIITEIGVYQDGSNLQNVSLVIKKNGVDAFVSDIYDAVLWGSFIKITENTTISVNFFDYIEFYLRFDGDYTGTYFNPKITAPSGVIIQPQNYSFFIYSLNTYLPATKQSDLMEYLFFIFGIIASFDRITETVILDCITDLNASQIDDWSGKLDNSQNIENNYNDFVSDYSKKNICKYLEEDDEGLLANYQAVYNETYGTGAISIDNDYLESETDYYEAPFYPTISNKVFTGISPAVNLYLPRIKRLDDSDAKILAFAGFQNVALLTNNKLASVTIFGQTKTTIPYSYFILPYNVALNDGVQVYHLGFGNPLDVPTNGNSILLTNYYNLQKVLNKPISITCSLKLTAYDISRLKFNRLKYIQELGGYFYLNKISQYDGSGEPTECELIKWY